MLVVKNGTENSAGLEKDPRPTARAKKIRELAVPLDCVA
jgi:hypothetical protein